MRKNPLKRNLEVDEVIRFNIPKPNKSLAAIAPELNKEWDYAKNSPNTPYTVGYGSSRKVWWKCTKGHSWDAIINNRVNGNGCPVCNNQIIQPGANSLIDTHPREIKLLWDFDRNNKRGISPLVLCAGTSLVKVYWKCPINENHLQWFATPSKVLQAKRGCPECSRKSGKVNYEDSLIVTHPALVKKEWDYLINDKAKIYPDKVSRGKHSKVAWKCHVASDHRWVASINKRALFGRGCPICANRITVQSNCLATTHPKLATEWDYKENKGCDPQIVNAGSNKKVFWVCHIDNSHEWAAQICQRTRTNSGCPHCHLLPESAQEIKIRFELMHIFPLMRDSNCKFRLRLSNRIISADIYIPEVNLAVEFDGSYWHRNAFKKDKEKTKLFKREGINIIRVRERPLKKITLNDVLSDVNSSPKIVTDLILMEILKMNICKENSKYNILGYLKDGELKGGKEANRYIQTRMKCLQAKRREMDK